jgi:hypothetical protein
MICRETDGGLDDVVARKHGDRYPQTEHRVSLVKHYACTGVNVGGLFVDRKAAANIQLFWLTSSSSGYT